MICPECHQPMDKMCDECGISFDEPEFVVHDLYNYMPHSTRNYKREDHFKEVLNQFQGKEGKDLPPDVLERINVEHQKDTTVPIKTVLRRLKLTKFVENERAIEFALFGKQPPYIPRLVEEKVVRMFKQVNRLYGTICIADCRTSFMNYYYVIYKLLELMGEWDLMKEVPMLKTPLRVRQHDFRWHLLCAELGWTFHPTYQRKVKQPAQPKQTAKRKPTKQ